MTAPAPSTPSDLELIAALVDGTLTAEQRRAALERVSRDDALRELYAETLAFKARESHPRRSPWPILGLAAAALLTVMFWPRHRTTFPLATLTAELTEAFAENPPGNTWYEVRWQVQRGSPTLSAQDGWFRVGVRMVQVDLALGSQRFAEAVLLSERTEALLSALAPTDGFHVLLVEARADLERGDSGRALRENLRLVDELVTDTDAHSLYELGKWAEAGRLAARYHQRSLVADNRFSAQAWEDVAMTSDQRAALDQIQAALQVSEPELGELEALFLQLIALY